MEISRLKVEGSWNGSKDWNQAMGAKWREEKGDFDLSIEIRRWRVTVSFWIVVSSRWCRKITRAVK